MEDADDPNEDDDEEDAEALPSRTQRRPILDSSPESNPGNDASRPGAIPEQSADLENDDGNAANDDFDPASNAVYRSGIVPDTLLDAGLLPEEPDDYSGTYANEPANEPEYDDQMDEPDNQDQQQADECDHDDEHANNVHMSHHVNPQSSHHPESHLSGQEPDMGGRTEANTSRQDASFSPANAFQISSSPDEGTAEAVGNHSNHLEDLQALFAAPHTDLRLIKQLLPTICAADFPMTLRINGKIIKTLGKLEYKDADNNPLEEYSIRVQLEDATCSCAAVLGHEILLDATGECMPA